MWSSKSLSEPLRIRLYTASITPIALYGCEAWSMTNEVKKLLKAFNAKCLSRILGIRVRQVVEENIGPSIIKAALKRRWLWLGHILRMSDSRAVKKVFLASNPRSPPYPAWGLTGILPWNYAEASKRALDRQKWENEFESVMK